MAFFLGVLFSMFVGRKIGWAISRRLLYSTSMAICLVVCLIWGFETAYALRVFILAMNPGLLLKIFAYGAGAYVSIPNYGLLDESALPGNWMARHVTIKSVPHLVFIVTSVAFAFFVGKR